LRGIHAINRSQHDHRRLLQGRHRRDRPRVLHRMAPRSGPNVLRSFHQRGRFHGDGRQARDQQLADIPRLRPGRSEAKEPRQPVQAPVRHRTGQLPRPQRGDTVLDRAQPGRSGQEPRDEHVLRLDGRAGVRRTEARHRRCGLPEADPPADSVPLEPRRRQRVQVQGPSGRWANPYHDAEAEQPADPPRIGLPLNQPLLKFRTEVP
jgi:hypothetical protein